MGKFKTAYYIFLCLLFNQFLNNNIAHIHKFSNSSYIVSSSLLRKFKRINNIAIPLLCLTGDILVLCFHHVMLLITMSLLYDIEPNPGPNDILVYDDLIQKLSTDHTSNSK